MTTDWRKVEDINAGHGLARDSLAGWKCFCGLHLWTDDEDKAKRTHDNHVRRLMQENGVTTDGN